MQIEALRHFIALADAGSFYQAAKQTNMSAPGYSKLLGSLERELGATLAERDNSGIHLTEAGRLLLDYAHEAVSGLNATVEKIALVNNSNRKHMPRLKVFATHYVMQAISYLDFLSESLIDFDLREEAFHKIMLRCENPSEDEMFSSEVFTESALAELSERHITFEPLYHSIMGVVVREDSPIAEYTRVPISELGNLNLSQYTQKEWNSNVERVYHSRLKPNIRFESTGMNMLLQYVRIGPDHALLGDSLGVYGVQKSGRFDVSGLVFVPFDDDTAKFSSGMLLPENGQLSLRAQAIIDAYRELARTKMTDYYNLYPDIFE